MPAALNGKQDWVDIMEKSIQGVVDISDKPVVERIAVATGKVSLNNESKEAITSNSVKKGNVQFLKETKKEKPTQLTRTCLLGEFWM